MTRVKRGTTANKRRKNVLKYAKGFRWGRKSKFKLAKDAVYHAWEYSYRDKKVKKRDFRKAWESRVNSACRKLDLSYSKFIAGLKKNKIALDRKTLADLSLNQPEIFQKIVEKIKG